jgi:hypothetical protein
MSVNNPPPFVLLTPNNDLLGYEHYAYNSTNNFLVMAGEFRNGRGFSVFDATFGCVIHCYEIVTMFPNGRYIQSLPIIWVGPWLTSISLIITHDSIALNPDKMTVNSWEVIKSKWVRERTPSSSSL